jgi:hypothetical protein
MNVTMPDDRAVSKRRLRREVYGAAALSFAVVGVILLLLLLLFNRAQVQLVSDLMVSALCLLPMLMCLLPVLIAAFVGIWGVGRLQNTAEASLIRAEHGADDLGGRVRRFARLAAEQAASFGVRLAWLDPWLSAFDPESSPDDSHKDTQV